MIEQSQFAGCLLGLALGDALGAPHEGGPLERLVWRLIGKTRQGKMRWTDDTQMSLDTAESLISLGKIDPDDLAQRFAASYRWSRGYGPGAARVLKRISRGADWRQASLSVYPDGSYGNGGAMRSPVVGVFFASKPGELVDAARLAARVTHAHPLGEEGAVLIAVATASAGAGDSVSGILGKVSQCCSLDPFRSRLAICEQWLADEKAPTVGEIRSRLGNGIAAADSCVTAVYCALRFLTRPFLDLQAFVASLGGDVDTIGAMAGAIWGAKNGAARLPEDQIARLEQADRLTVTATKLSEKVRHRKGGHAGQPPA